jgi:hypothetical protein
MAWPRRLNAFSRTRASANARIRGRDARLVRPSTRRCISLTIRELQAQRSRASPWRGRYSPDFATIGELRGLRDLRCLPLSRPTPARLVRPSTRRRISLTIRELQTQRSRASPWRGRPDSTHSRECEHP